MIKNEMSDGNNKKSSVNVIDHAGNDSMDTAQIEELLATDTGKRSPSGLAHKFIVYVAIFWSLFQIWYASPLPFIMTTWLKSIGFTVDLAIGDDKARSIHLSLALLLCFLMNPAFHSSPRKKIPLFDWFLSFFGAGLALYFFLNYDQFSMRQGNPNHLDIFVGVCGLLVLLEAARRALGPPLAIIAILFLAFNFLGPYLPEMIAHDRNGLANVINHQWITTEGVFGVALGVSVKFVFLFVLFGALLEKAGAGNYFIKTAFSFLGHLRGGPAKAAVVGSALSGMISGSSIANVVTTGTFTIPMMKRVGFSKEKAGAVEVSSSVNGQLMPPVMGAAAFLMVEYVGVSYIEVVKAAIIPALISYIALFFIVHIEAVKMNLPTLERANKPPKLLIRAFNIVSFILFLVVLSLTVYYVLGWVSQHVPHPQVVIIVLMIIVYLLLLKRVSKFSDLELDDTSKPIVTLPPIKETVNAGLHFLLPVVVLIWCLMVERLSPATSAFWGTMVLLVILFTQRPLLVFFRKHGDYQHAIRHGITDIFEGLETAAKNMIGIAIATAAAGIIVGVVSLTGIGSAFSNLVELASGGNILIMLILVAMLSLVLGMGLPTTANYIVVSSLMAGVIVEVGRSNGLIVPLIAVHMFVFYFGIMADVTPPVGLASFAAAAISGGSPMKTGVIAFFYSLRTAALPFLFIFNTDLLLLNVTWWHGIIVFFIATLAMLVFTAATQRYLFDKCRWYEVVLLLFISFALFRPGYFMNKISPVYNDVPVAQVAEKMKNLPKGTDIMLHIKSVDRTKTKTFYAHFLSNGKDYKEIFNSIGLEVDFKDDKLAVTNVAMMSPAEKYGFDSFYDQTILDVDIKNHDAWSKEWLYLLTLPLLVLISWIQIRRKKL